jgi:hypothetical protein
MKKRIYVNSSARSPQFTVAYKCHLLQNVYAGAGGCPEGGVLLLF